MNTILERRERRDLEEWILCVNISFSFNSSLTTEQCIYLNATTAIHMLIYFIQYQACQSVTSEHPWQPRLGVNPGEANVAVTEHDEDDGQPEDGDHLPRAHRQAL